MSKPKHMCFKPKSLSILFIPNMYFNGEVLTTVGKTSKYLGVFIDCDAHDVDESLCTKSRLFIQEAAFCLADLIFSMMMLI